MEVIKFLKNSLIIVTLIKARSRTGHARSAGYNGYHSVLSKAAHILYATRHLNIALLTPTCTPTEKESNGGLCCDIKNKIN